VTGARVDASDITALVAGLRAAAPTVRRDLPARMRKVGDVAARDARQRASWSSRIPDAIRVGTQTRGGRAGVFLRVVAAKAPHARAYEGLAKGGSRVSFRHPVFGDRDRWVTQRTRPFLVPAVQARRDQVNAELSALIDRAAAQAGLRRTG
jgi:hypothetical protein